MECLRSSDKFPVLTICYLAIENWRMTISISANLQNAQASINFKPNARHLHLLSYTNKFKRVYNMLFVADLEGFCKFDKIHMSHMCCTSWSYIMVVHHGRTSWSYLAILVLDIYHISHNRRGSQIRAQYPRHGNIMCL